MNNIIISAYENLPESARGQAAQELHEQVLDDVRKVQEALLDFCKSLKTMRDTKLYIELGFSEFDEYVEQRVGIRRRQAYNYIQTYERLGNQIMQSNARLGITKLQLLTEISAVDREEFIENNDLGGMSVAEIKELIAQNNNRGEQLTLLQEQLEEIKSQENTPLQENEELKRRIKELESRPVEVAVQEPTKEQLDKIKLDLEKQYKKDKADAVKKAKEKAVADAEKEKAEAIKKAKQEAEKEATQKLQSAIEQADKDKAEALKKAQELSEKMQKNADSDLVTANYQFMTATEFFDSFLESVNKIASSDNDKANKLKHAAVTYLNDLINRVEG